MRLFALMGRSTIAEPTGGSLSPRRDHVAHRRFVDLLVEVRPVDEEATLLALFLRTPDHAA